VAIQILKPPSERGSPVLKSYKKSGSAQNTMLGRLTYASARQARPRASFWQQESAALRSSSQPLACVQRTVILQERSLHASSSGAVAAAAPSPRPQRFERAGPTHPMTAARQPAKTNTNAIPSNFEVSALLTGSLF